MGTSTMRRSIRQHALQPSSRPAGGFDRPPTALAATKNTRGLEERTATSRPCGNASQASGRNSVGDSGTSMSPMRIAVDSQRGRVGVKTGGAFFEGHAILWVVLQGSQHARVAKARPLLCIGDNSNNR